MRQSIVIIGGYNSLWPSYLHMARILEDLSGFRAVAVPLMPWHWWRARRVRSATNVLLRLQETVDWARRRHGTASVILVGHSAGGLVGRLYLSHHPVWDRIYNGQEHVTSLVTLGSPHCSERGSHTGWFLGDAANRLAPGAPFADRVQYVAVAGSGVQGRARGTLRERRAYRIYQFFSGRGDHPGDGVVPVPSAELEGAQSIVLEGVVHSARSGSNWYGGSKAVIQRWWLQEDVHDIISDA